MNDKARQIITLLLTLGMVAMSIIGQVSDLGGQAIDETSNENYTLLNPAPYAFSIWGLIYLGLLGFGIYQVLPAQRNNPRFRAAFPWVVLNAIVNMLWYFAAYNQTWNNIAPNILIVLMLFSLVKINEALLIRSTSAPAGETWLARMPFALYFGWVTVATPVSIASLLAYNGWNGGAMAPDIWTVIILAVALLIACYTYLRVTNFAYLIAIAWGFIAIAVEQQNTSAVVYWAALVGALVAIVVGIATFFANNQTEPVAERG